MGARWCCWWAAERGVAVELIGLCRGSQESAAVLAAVPVAAGWESSITCSRFVSVRLSLEGARAGSSMTRSARVATGVVSSSAFVFSSATGAGAATGSRGSATSSVGSAGLALAWLGAGASFAGTVDWRSMLAQVLAPPAAGAGLLSVVSVLAAVSPQAEDSSVGTDSCWFSLLREEPLVAGWAVRPRGAAPPRPPLSVARPRPRPPSETVRPPRAAREAVNVCSVEAVVAAAGAASLAFVRDGFLVLETSPH